MAKTPPGPADDDLLMPRVAAGMVGVDAKTMTRWAKSGKVPCIRTLGGHRRYRRGVINEIVARGATGLEGADADA